MELMNTKTPRPSPRVRRLRKSRQRGVTVFIVMMAIVLLTALGAWVVYASGFASSAAGYQRASSQTLYIAELGILSSAGYWAKRENIQSSFDAVRVAGPDTCRSAASPAPNDFCKSLLLSEVSAETLEDTAGAHTLIDLTAEGSMGPLANETIGDFYVEMTDPQPATVAGAALTGPNSNLYRRVTLTAYGRVRPDGGVGGDLCTGATAINTVASQVGMRAHAIVGPVN